MKSFHILFVLSMVTFSFCSTLSEDILLFSSDLFANSSITDTQHIAVLPFETTESHSDGDLGTAFAEFLISDIVQNNRSKIVERMQLNTIMQEMMLSESGMIDQNDMVELGKMAAADYLINGKITKAMGSYLISAQIVNTETSEIVGAARMTLPVTSANNQVAQLYETHNYPREAAFRSLVVPGLGQAYSGEKGHAIVAASLCGVGLASTITTGVLQHNQNIDYKAYAQLGKTNGYKEEQQRIMDSLAISASEADDIYSEIKDDMYDEYESKRTAFAISAGVTGGLWVWNVIDAVFMGKRAEEKYQLYFSSNPINETYSATFVYNF